MFKASTSLPLNVNRLSVEIDKLLNVITCIITISYLKYFRAETVINFSMKSSESRTAMCAALPIRELAVFGKA